MAYGVINEEELNIFNKPARLLIRGFSGYGKNCSEYALIKNYRYRLQSVIIPGSDLENSTELGEEFDSEFNPFQEFLKRNTFHIFDYVCYNKKVRTLAGEVFIR